MCKKLLPFLAIASLILVFALGCAGGSQSATPAYVGTWTTSSGGITQTIVLTAKTMSVSDSMGTMDCSISSVDEGAGHMLMSVTASTGLYALVSPGSPYYVTYSVSGNTLMFAGDNSAYPSSATIAYTKQ